MDIKAIKGLSDITNLNFKMKKQIWHLDFTSYWGDVSNLIVILGLHFYKDDIGIILFNFSFRIVKY